MLTILLVLALAVCAVGWLNAAWTLSTKRPYGEKGDTSIAKALYHAQDLPYPTFPLLTIPDRMTTRHGAVIAAKGIAVMIATINEAANGDKDTFLAFLEPESDQALFDAYESLAMLADLTRDLRNDIIQLAISKRPELSNKFAAVMPQWPMLLKMAALANQAVEVSAKKAEPQVIVPQNTTLPQ